MISNEIPSRTIIHDMERDISLSRSKGEGAKEALKHVRGWFDLEHFKAAYDSAVPPRRVIFLALRGICPKQQPATGNAEQPETPAHSVEDADISTPAKPAAKEHRKTLPPQGVADWNPHTFTTDFRDCILEDIGITLDDGGAFLDEIEHAVSLAVIRKGFKTKRAEVKQSLCEVKEAAAKLVKALEGVPVAGQSLVRNGGLPFSTFQQQAREQLAVATRAAVQAQESLSGRGDDRDQNPAMLAADIAAALRRIGIETPNSPGWR